MLQDGPGKGVIRKTGIEGEQATSRDSSEQHPTSMATDLPPLMAVALDDSEGDTERPRQFETYGDLFRHFYGVSKCN